MKNNYVLVCLSMRSSLLSGVLRMKEKREVTSINTRIAIDESLSPEAVCGLTGSLS